MPDLPPAVAQFLIGRRIAVAGVSRRGDVPANAILAHLRKQGHEVVAINPAAAPSTRAQSVDGGGSAGTASDPVVSTLDGAPCYPDLRAVAGPVDGLIIATPPGAAAELLRQAAERGVRAVWLHRSFGTGSVDDAAVAEARRLGLDPIVGGCPLMYLTPDPFHRCMRWWLRRSGRVPG